MESFGKRTTIPGDKAELEAAIESFKRATDIDSHYALARAQLAYCYTWMARFSEPKNPSWMTLARQTLDEAERLDPQLAEVHVARYNILWSNYGRFQIVEAIREMRLAQPLSPRGAPTEMGTADHHPGFRERALREVEPADQI